MKTLARHRINTITLTFKRIRTKCILLIIYEHSKSGYQAVPGDWEIMGDVCSMLSGLALAASDRIKFIHSVLPSSPSSNNWIEISKIDDNTLTSQCHWSSTLVLVCKKRKTFSLELERSSESRFNDPTIQVLSRVRMSAESPSWCWHWIQIFDRYTSGLRAVDTWKKR